MIDIKRILCRFFLIFLCLEFLLGWGFFSHKKINYYFVTSLRENKDAEPLFSFYNKHINYIVDHAGDPDSRRAYSRSEGEKHFLNIECFGDDIMQQDYVSYDEFVNYYAYNLAKKLRPELKTSEEIEKYVKNKILKEYGINPWAIIHTKKALTEAFKNKDINRILLETINLAHYIADSCVVFHCTSNYNGQLTGQEGIHAFWENTIPQYFFDEFDVAKSICLAKYDKVFNRTIWKNVLRSNIESKRALDVEKQLDKDVKLGKFCYKARKNTVNRMHSKEYSREYNRRLNGQIANQIKRSIMLIADAVYTAWMDAGKPILLDIAQENSPAQIERGSGPSELIVQNKNKKGNARSNNKNQKEKRENKDNAAGNAASGDKREISKGATGSVVACIVAFITAYLLKYRRKRKKEKSGNGKKVSKK